MTFNDPDRTREAPCARRKEGPVGRSVVSPGYAFSPKFMPIERRVSVD